VKKFHMNTESRSKHQQRTSLRNQTVRVARDYPWLVLDALKGAIGSHLSDKEASTLSRVIRERDVDGYLNLSASMGLQSINSVENSESWANHEVRVMLSSVLKKYPFDGDAEARKRAGIQMILLGEQCCSTFNRVGRRKLLGADDKVLNEAKWFIRKILGSSLPSKEELTRTARHGPGASTGTSSGNTSAFDKFAGYPYDVTARCFDHACDLLVSDERWYEAVKSDIRTQEGWPSYFHISKAYMAKRCFNIVKGNKITTVPKDARKERPIAIEPTMNMMLQLGVDGYIRKKLKPWGIDLDDQTKNQKLAYAGSIRMDYCSPATIDLAMASDTISLGVVKLLLPEPWFRYLCEIRSPMGTLPDGSKIRYSKLSSMGNGSTFAIESLIFGALMFGVTKCSLGYYPKEDVSIFGDDIICPEGCAPTLVQYLKLCGFHINREKSFLQGQVKESCGTDWFRGHSLRPVHLHDVPTVVGELFSDRNRITRWLTLHGYYTSEVQTSIDSLYHKWVPERFRALVGPVSDTEFDTYWHDSCSDWRKGSTRKYTQVYVGKALYARYKQRRLQARDFDFVKLSARLISQNESFVDPARLPHWMNPLRKQSASGSVFSVYETNSIRRGVRQRVWYELPSSYTSAEDLLLT